jgi:hypothetical protein
MNVKLVSKNNVGAIATLLLIILLSHARFFDFLVDSALGRAILILFILGISYTNKILGVVAVLFIIISINNSDIGYLEGFTGASNIKEKKVNDKKEHDKKEHDKRVNAKKEHDKRVHDKRVNDKKIHDKMINDKMINYKKVNDKKVNDKRVERKSIEGFNITEREHMMLKGKRSNEAIVYSNSRNSDDDDVEPSNKSIFTDNYSSV